MPTLFASVCNYIFAAGSYNASTGDCVSSRVKILNASLHLSSNSNATSFFSRFCYGSALAKFFINLRNC